MPKRYDEVIHDTVVTHVAGFQLAFVVSAALALAGMVMAIVLVRREDRVATGPVFGRRSRWVLANVAATPATTRVPPPEDRDPPEASLSGRR